MNVGPAGIEVAYERLGDPQAPAVLLVMGIGAQLIGWPDGFCAALVARGVQVIRFDNRDSGWSSHFADAPAPDFVAALAGDTSSASYTLSDMAADTVGLLDVLGLGSAHIVGASLGGAIAQTAAIEHPGRIRSLTSVMSTTGDQAVGQARPEALRAFGGPSATSREEVIERTARISRALGSPGFAFDEAAAIERARRSYDRSYDPVGITRQAVASLASGDRTERLRSLEVPALVIHGADDPMCDVSGGRATAAAIPGAELVVIDGMGHNLPDALWPDIAELITKLVHRAETHRRRPGAAISL
ncbi:alpha/beta fold hydrolase [Streptomyces sp. NBC_01565]|uniref:alpha/beta fold hydrolase n=1 Tax=unclassified Streptomyces TaxID=2593676 RepID=UPI00224FC4A7|nr:alpha/beta hydrolase [Streptomyces sp. NBC_01565]MCX4539486.1 alpha/beta fold hydrolase [Streptomyces sp. NBC_01565]